MKNWGRVMQFLTIKTVGKTLFLPLALALISSSAWALPDLIINTADSTVSSGSCDTNEPLASGRIAIKNQGESAAALGVTTRFTQTMLAVYVPENIDMMDTKQEREKLDPYDQEGIEFEIGRDVQKRSRFFGDPSKKSASSSGSYSATERILGIQKALAKLGYYEGSVDGVSGPNTRAAIQRFQSDQSASPTGRLKQAQLILLFERTGISLEHVTGATGKVRIGLYAVVDPYNLIAESNEANNIEYFSIEIDCSE